MVAKIKIGQKLRGALHYNENKVAEGQAELILASGFAGDIEHMNFGQKLRRFENLLMLKPSVKTNTLHISLNFDATEKLSDDTLQKIAISYMDKIGFGDQPFIAYRHHDAAHDHIHLVTTNIQANSKAIDLHNIGRVKSEKARKEIEEEFKLVKAQGKRYKPEPGIKAIDPAVADYGRIPTKRAISNTISAVVGSYKFTSLAELNAILKQFNVTAWRGDEGTPMFDNKGLVYSLTDKEGNRIGVPIKASAFYAKPTLRNLEPQFEKHKLNRVNDKPALRKRIDTALLEKPKNRQEFTTALKKQGVALVYRETKEKAVHGVTFVDHISKTVFNGSSLGKGFTANVLMDTLKMNSLSQNKQEQNNGTLQNEPSTHEQKQHNGPGLLDTLLKEQYEQQGQLPKKKKRRLKI